MPSVPELFLYDTTLRDGAQRRDLSFSLEDKLKMTRLLDRFGIPYIEGGWPGSNPKDAEYFRRVDELELQQAKLCAFGSTRRVGVAVEDDAQLHALLDARTPVVTLVGKSWDLHVTEVLRTTRQENLKLISDSIAYLKASGREVVFDAEHFFDGYRSDSAYALECLLVAAEAGADWLVLCDTNGGTLPQDVFSVVSSVKAHLNRPIGIHTHNDAELAVANALAAVAAGARQVQGTINGYGERCGNANLVSLLPSLQLKLGYHCVSEEHLAMLTELSSQVAEIANVNLDPFAPYVGNAAFSHKGGIHVAAVERLSASYEHIEPERIGNRRSVVVSELAGRGNVRMRAQELGIDIDGRESEILTEIKRREAEGLHLEAADGSFELLVRRLASDYQAPFELLDLVVQSQRRNREAQVSQATVKLRVGHDVVLTVAEAGGPVDAIDKAARKALVPFFPELRDVRLTDYKVRIVDPEAATSATTRVWIEAAIGDQRWCTVGCSDNIIDASSLALIDSLELFLLRSRNAALGVHHGYHAA